MRILRIIASLNPKDGGPAEGLKRSTEVINCLGHLTEVACLDVPGAPWLSGLPFTVHALGPGTKPYGYSPRLVPFIKSNRGRFDIAVIHGLWNYASLGGWLGLRKGPTPYVVFTHGMLDPWFKRTYPIKHMAKQVYWLLFEGRILGDAQRVLFTSEEERLLARRSFLGHQGYKGQVVAYGAADAPGDRDRELSTFHQAVPTVRGRRFLLFLSRIHPKKGCDLLISAFSRVSELYPDLDLVIAGPDQSGWRRDLERLAADLHVADRLHWPGMLTGPAKWGAFQAAEAFVLPSHQENFGIVVAEAMACGVPVLITNKVNIWREVEASGGGLAAPDDEEGVTSLLADFLRSDEARKVEMRQAARRAFKESFHVRAAAESLLSVLTATTRAS